MNDENSSEDILDSLIKNTQEDAKKLFGKDSKKTTKKSELKSILKSKSILKWNKKRLFQK